MDIDYITQQFTLTQNIIRSLEVENNKLKNSVDEIKFYVKEMAKEMIVLRKEVENIKDSHETDYTDYSMFM